MSIDGESQNIFNEAPLFSLLPNYGEPNNLYSNSEALFARYQKIKSEFEQGQKELEIKYLDNPALQENFLRVTSELAMLREVLIFLNYELDE